MLKVVVARVAVGWYLNVIHANDGIFCVWVDAFRIFGLAIQNGIHESYMILPKNNRTERKHGIQNNRR
jgi:hypothetical protein